MTTTESSAATAAGSAAAGPDRGETAEAVVLGAGPHGLSAAMHLCRAGVETRIIGDPMSFWRTMPAGMLLRSNWSATCIGDHVGPYTLDAYAADIGESFRTPFPLERFLDYGMWVQRQVAPDVDRRHVERVEQRDGRFVLSFTHGERLRTRRLVVAGGIAPFANRPEVAAGLPRELTSHTADHDDLSVFSGRRVLVVGGGQSALESAALMHESGADVLVVVRQDHLTWLHGGVWHRRLGRATPLLYAPTDVGPMGLSRVVAVPDLFRRLPRGVQDPAAHRSIRPAGAAWLLPRIADIPIRLGVTVRAVRPERDGLRVELSNGESRTVDHLLFGTGYRVDVRRYPFLSPDLAASIEQVGGYPVLRRGLESSVPGLHIVGAPAARSFGPIMRFVSGGWYGGQAVAKAAARARRRSPSADRTPASR
jgi:FAD-dependent urate hydroxylase